ncbi:MAG TPA: hypothetical protein PLV61_16505, partial [Parvularculaceae bacterium]|nr:hypothetical protein [Parvularculaceae bacterium]
YWRDDLRKVMKHRCPVSSRFTAYTTETDYELEHLALPIFGERKVVAIVGGFDFVESDLSVDIEFDWQHVKHVHRLYQPALLMEVLSLRRGNAGRSCGAFHEIASMLPRTLPYWFSINKVSTQTENLAPLEAETSQEP